ncbi:F0F1 ATP synthase subunit B [Pseudomonas sp. LD120]|uniref:F0F1 ATP synthase subunit B family protein n=1 Tax=Pseudomonas sp. LD120 TaxID=485751 RepID=UPI00135BAB90|nr:F0F1 ATP synthase subunit B [Pseudomonas sp. LD120]KAF0866608.1 F0F1 ATP synthase subunit B [Pseudomonas sp. LD120]
MLIDWFTVSAQVLNFLILVWLMKRFLYQPVLNAIAAREAKIAAELKDAAETKARAHQQQSQFEAKNQAFDEQRAALLSQATEAANAERARLLAQARQAAEAASAMRAKALLSEHQHLHTQIVQRTQQQVYQISRQVLADLAGSCLEQQACEVFIQRLRALDPTAQEALVIALKASTADEPVLLRSAFELPAAQRAAIQAALEAAAAQALRLRFETAPELVSGIELSAKGVKLAWSIAQYLDALAASPPAPQPGTERP